ncbi:MULTISPECIES: class I adenylate-forming enzyme family protein [Salimicrobium]|uniref:AMP-dependent synthetase n=3 Tax=Salimicrobium TaxID=351195 RepID=K2G891_9BACI|nr:MULTISPECIES: AMP-binding protein [Salimicrobium]AKG05357.1 AMP-dependent synthetase [Salimicrobium jeotgali]EKE31363.1 AMP-dependent synthetase and ligase [Salimicrobium jeotgali]MBM7696973.1 long-chain acyl-CoA synthetase [Salimicrobium jeotgali]PBB04984.1 AMP-dependent synthetase [Salimicrobium humidisoli]SDY07802.1 long-chain acyl-CoA synthetase [Salimicrobium album]
MEEVLRKNWPEGLSKKLEYRSGERPLHEYLIQNAEEMPEEPAYIYYGNTITWKDLEYDTRRFAGFLKSKGIAKGECVGVFMQNCPQYLITHYAAQMLGTVVVPLNPMYKESELEYFINEAGIKAIVSGDELYQRIENVSDTTPSLQFSITTNYADYLPDSPTLPVPAELLMEKNIGTAYDMKEVTETAEPLPETEPIDIWNDVGLMVFTSGTTGRPKAALLTYGNALFKTAATAQGYRLEQEDRTLASAPLSHIAGMVMGVNIPVYSALQSVLLTRFEPEAAIQAIEKYKINKLYTIAMMNAAILNYPDIEKRDLNSLELNFATSFGMQVDESLAEKWKRITEGCILLEASYGLSETHTCDTFMPIEHIKFGTCGIATYDTSFRIVDTETGEDLPPGEQGEIAVKNPGVFKGYLNRPEETDETLREGWVFTGDIGKIDEDGYLYFIGRVKEMIKSSGFSVFPGDVEAMMSEHEAVAQVACVGVPDAEKGEVVKAFVVLNPSYETSISEKELVEWARDKMAAYKYPRAIEFIEEMPSTSSGKVLRRFLKE